MELINLFRVLRSSWLFLLIMGIVGISIAELYSVTKIPIFTASSTIRVQIEQPNNDIESLILARGKEGVLAQFLVNEFIASEQSQNSSSSISVSPSDASSIIITAQGAKQQNVIQLVDSRTVSFLKIANSYSNLSQPFEVIIVEPTKSIVLPDQLTGLKLLALGAALGLFAGLTISLLYDSFNRKIFSKQDVEAVTLSPVLGDIFPPASLDNAALDSYRDLRAQLLLDPSDSKFQTLLLTSAKGEIPVLSVAVQLAESFAQSGLKAIVIDSDFESKFQAADQSVSFGDLLQGEITVSNFFGGKTQTNPVVLPAGNIREPSSDLLISKQFDLVISELRQIAEVLIIASPPVLNSSDVLILGKKVGNINIVVGQGITLQKQLVLSLQKLRLFQPKHLNIVFMKKVK